MTMAKGIMIVDGQRVPFDGEKNVLSVIRTSVPGLYDGFMPPAAFVRIKISAPSMCITRTGITTSCIEYPS